MKKYGVIYKYNEPMMLEKIEVFKIIRNPISYIIFTNEGLRGFQTLKTSPKKIF